MTHIKVKFDKPYCFWGHQVQFDGEFCGPGYDCTEQEGKDVCKYLRFQHIESEQNVDNYEFREFPDPNSGLVLYGFEKVIPINTISYLEIDGRILIDFEV